MKWLGIALSILGSFYFAGIEMAFVSARKKRLHAFAEDKKKLSWILKRLKDPKRMLVTILIGNNLCIIFGSLLAEKAFYEWFGELGRGISFFGMTLVFFLLSELIPKNLFRMAPEDFLLSLAPLTRILFILICPFERLITFLVSLIPGNSLKGKEEVKELEREEFHYLIKEGLEEKIFHPEDEDFTQIVLDLGHETVQSRMTPWEKNVLLTPSQGVEEFIGAVGKKEQSFALVCDLEESNNIQGIIFLNDCIFNPSYDGYVKDFMISPTFISPQSTLSEAFSILQNVEGGIGIVQEGGPPEGVISLSALKEIF